MPDLATQMVATAPGSLLEMQYQAPRRPTESQSEFNKVLMCTLSLRSAGLSSMIGVSKPARSPELLRKTGVSLRKGAVRSSDCVSGSDAEPDLGTTHGHLFCGYRQT